MKVEVAMHASWATVPNKPTVSVNVKQHFNNNEMRAALRTCVKVEVAMHASWATVPNKPTVSVNVKQHFNNNEMRAALRSCVKVEVAVLDGFCGRKATLNQQIWKVGRRVGHQQTNQQTNQQTKDGKSKRTPQANKTAGENSGIKQHR